MIIILVSVLGIIFSVTALSRVVRSNLFHPVVFFSIFCIIDVYLPGILWKLFGYPRTVNWMLPLTEKIVEEGICYYLLYYILFLSVLVVASRRSVCVVNRARPKRRNLRNITFGVWFMLFCTLYVISQEILLYGGINSWFLSKLSFSGARVTGEVGRTFSFAFIRPVVIFCAMVGLAFFYREHFRNKWIYSYVMPFLAVILSMVTAYRGLVLFVIVTLAFIETERNKNIYHKDASGNKPRKQLKLMILTTISFVFIFSIYSGVRDGYRSMVASGVTSKFEIKNTNIFYKGYGLIGVSQIVAQYGETQKHLDGKTYFDMLMLPVPRLIYTSKPVWYGTDDITILMGWPKTTMSAVSMPGEAFANFGIYGLFVAVLFGALYGFVYKKIQISSYHYLLITPTVSFQMMSTTNWMSFTGFMNSLISVMVLYTVASLLRLLHGRI